MKNNKWMLVFPLALVLSGCNDKAADEVVPAEVGGSEATLKNLPNKRNVDLPKSLLQGELKNGQPGSRSIKTHKRTLAKVLNKTTRMTDESIAPTTTSYGYEQIIDTVTQMEFSALEQSIDLLMLDSVWDQITASCVGVDLGTSCQIASGEIELRFDASLIAAVESIEREMAAIDSSYWVGGYIVDESFLLGSIVYTQYGIEADYQYEIVLDLSSIEEANSLETESVEDGFLVSDFYGVKWSEDQKRVVTEFESRFEEVDSFSNEYSYAFAYVEVDGNATAVLRELDRYNSIDSLYPFQSSNEFLISLSEIAGSLTHGINISFEQQSSTSDGFEDSVSSLGQADDNGGFLRSEGEFTWVDPSSDLAETIVFNEEEIFGGEGNLLSYRFCNIDCSNEANWTAVNLDEVFGAFEESEFYIPGDELILIDPTFADIAIVVNGITTDGEYVIAAAGFNGDFMDILGLGRIEQGLQEFSYWGTPEQLDSVVIYHTEINLDTFEFEYSEVVNGSVSLVGGM